MLRNILLIHIEHKRKLIKLNYAKGNVHHLNKSQEQIADGKSSISMPC